jgi:phosphoglycerate dehydrogenase-like enzyme
MPRSPNVLILLTLPEPVRTQYHARLREKFPALTITMVDHYSKVDPYIATADVLITFGPMLADHADDVVRRAKSLRWIQALGTGLDNIIDLPSLRPDIVITNMRGIHGAPVSEAAIAAMLALSRDLPRVVRNQERCMWDRWPARLLDGKTVGILGVGAIAEALAPKCKALGMTVVGISSAPREAPGFDRMYDRGGLVRAVRELDYFVLLTPYSAQTRGIVAGSVLSAMKPTSFLINLARGGIVDEAALVEALTQGRIAGAALDVFNTEPLPAHHPFWSMTNVIVTPHLGGFCDVYVDHTIPVIEENMRRFLAGDVENMINLVKR